MWRVFMGNRLMMSSNVDMPDDYLQIKADIFRIIRSHSDSSPKKIMRIIKEHLPDVEPDVIHKCIAELTR